MTAPSRPCSILVCALGGEGGGVLSEWLYDVAVRAGHSAQCTSIPGVAQRTGATTYYIEVWPQPDAALAGRRPLFGLNPVPGEIDLLVSSELLETARQIGLGLASAERTHVVSSSARALTVAERMVLGDGRFDAATLVAALQRHSRSCTLLDLGALAREAGTVISAVMLGAIAASGTLPFERALYEAAIRHGGKGVDASLRGFALGLAAVQGQQQHLQALPPTPLPQPPALPAALQQHFPAAVHELLALGHARLVDYQDAAYAALYVQRLERVLAAEQAADPGAAQGHAITREMARWLALWMAFDDIVRVAALKLRASRSARVRREVSARSDEIVKVFDHFKPGVPEFAALLPVPLAERLKAWDARRAEPLALPLKLGTHTIFGAMALRALAALKGQRRRGSRFALEQALIERWLAAVERGTREHWALGHELAQSGRLIKGYGSTNERGKAKLLHLTEHLAQARTMPAPAARAEAVRSARIAALADDAGRAFDAALQAHGAPARPLQAQPVRWYSRPPATGARRTP